MGQRKAESKGVYVAALIVVYIAGLLTFIEIDVLIRILQVIRDLA